jgi:CRISPR type I-E-associated protein CasB/Cse2
VTLAEKFVLRLQGLKEGERSRLRRAAGMPLHTTVMGFDLFTGLWWPLRDKSPSAPRRETSWLVAKLFGDCPIPHVRPPDSASRPSLQRVLGHCEPYENYSRNRFRRRFDLLLLTNLTEIEVHLQWALRVADSAVSRGRFPGIDWAQLIDDLSIWDRGLTRGRRHDIRDIWAEEYLDAAHHNQRR